jgi:hypothetical protein
MLKMAVEYRSAQHCHSLIMKRYRTPGAKAAIWNAAMLSLAVGAEDDMDGGWY